MTEKVWVEIPVFIHGITPEREPQKDGILKNYDDLLENIYKALDETTNQQGFKKFTGDPIKVFWSFETDSGETQSIDSLLAAAQDSIYEKVLESEDHNFISNILDLTVPTRFITQKIRALFVLGMSDLFYYISKDGEIVIRNHVFGHIYQDIKKYIDNPNTNISLTFFGHSAGSVITHDLLHHLFRSDADNAKSNDKYIKEIASMTDEQDQTKADAIRNKIEAITSLRKLISDDRLRVRRFYSMGSPIASTILRADSMLKRVKDKNWLTPEEKGFKESDGLSNPRWVNFWDIDDVAAYPVEVLYTNPIKIIDKKEVTIKVIEDQHINVSNGLPDHVHAAYWTSPNVAAYIAKTL